LLWLWIYILKGWLTPGSNAGTVNRLPLLQTEQSGSDTHPATYVFSILSCFRGGTAAGPSVLPHNFVRCCCWEWVELYHCSPYMPSWHLQGLLLF